MSTTASRGTRRVLPLALAATFALAAASEGQLLSIDPAGVKQTNRLVKKADALIDEVDRAQQQIRVTLAEFNDLVAGSETDLRKPYRALDKSIGKCEKRREAVRDRLDATKAEADEYFRGWAASLPMISSEELRARSEARMRDTRARFDGVLEAGRRANAEYEPFLVSLRDQWTYLGHDLNPAGLESLRPEALELNERGTQLLLEIDESLRKARDYVASIRTEQPPPPPPPVEEPPPQPPAAGAPTS